MIRNTFSILDGVGGKTERRLWSEGVLTWEDFLVASSISTISGRRKGLYDQELVEAEENLDSGNSSYFASALKCSEHWRLFDTFRDRAVCLDIETSGYQPYQGGYPTVVGLYDGEEYKSFIWGEDLTAEAVMEDLSRYKYLITFFGSVFDLPFLRLSLPGFELDMPHFDLCFGAKKLGLDGGLKAIERTLGIERQEETRGLDGYDAVLLWQRASAGSSAALELLLSYNREDTVNLMQIAGVVYSGLRASTGIEEYLS